MIVAALVALGTFAAVTSFVASVSAQVGNHVTVYRAKEPIDPYTALTANNLEPVEVPERWVSKSEVLRLGELEGRRVGFRVNAGSTISSDMLVPSSELSSDEREIAINVDAVTGIGGRVRPGDRVDIYATFADVPGLAKQTRELVKDVRIVSMEGTQTVVSSSDDGVGQKDVIPVTLALVPKDAKAVTYASAFAQEVRLVGLPTDVGAKRKKGESSVYDARRLGGVAVKEGVR